jgi:hypothetical protein
MNNVKRKEVKSIYIKKFKDVEITDNIDFIIKIIALNILYNRYKKEASIGSKDRIPYEFKKLSMIYPELMSKYIIHYKSIFDTHYDIFNEIKKIIEDFITRTVTSNNSSENILLYDVNTYINSRILKKLIYRRYADMATSEYITSKNTILLYLNTLYSSAVDFQSNHLYGLFNRLKEVNDDKKHAILDIIAEYIKSHNGKLENNSLKIHMHFIVRYTFSFINTMYLDKDTLLGYIILLYNVLDTSNNYKGRLSYYYIAPSLNNPKCIGLSKKDRDYVKNSLKLVMVK